MSYSIQTTNAFALLEPAEDDSHAREATVVEKEETSAAGNKPVDSYSNQGANDGLRRESSAPTRGGHSRGDRVSGPRANRNERYYSREGDDRRYRAPRDGRGRGRGRNFGAYSRGGSQMSNGYNHNDASRAGEEQDQITAEGKDAGGTEPHENGDGTTSNGKATHTGEDTTAVKDEEEEEEEKQVSYEDYMKEQEEKRKNLNTKREVNTVMEKFDGMKIRERKEEEVLVVGAKEKNEKTKKERKEKNAAGDKRSLQVPMYFITQALKFVVENLDKVFVAKLKWSDSQDKPRKDFRKDTPPRGRGRYRGGDSRYRGGGRRGRGEGRGGRYSSPNLDVEDTNAFPSLS